MAKDHRKVNTELAQRLSLDDSGFLLRIVKIVLRELRLYLPKFNDM